MGVPVVASRNVLFIIQSFAAMSPTMAQLRRRLQASGPHRPIVVRRSASHRTPHYNEPGGWLFGEKMPSLCPLRELFILTSALHLAPTPWPETSEGGQGEHL